MSFDLPAVHSKYGVLDIGSNSVRLVIYEVFGASFTPIYNEKVLAGLGRKLRETGALSPQGRTRALAALARFKSIAEAQGVEKFIIGATAALRDASDAQSFIVEVQTKTGLNITPISGEQEAYLSAMGVLSATPNANGIIADLGGASLELVSAADQNIKTGQTFPLGPFQMMDTDAEFQPSDIPALKHEIREILKAGFAGTIPPKGQALYLVGGAWRNLAAIHQKLSGYPLKILQSYAPDGALFRAFTSWALDEGLADIQNWQGLSQRRLETLPYAAVLFEVLQDELQPSEIIISETGLREGLIFDALPVKQRAREALHDGCFALAQGNLQSDEFAQPLYEFLSQDTLHVPLPAFFDESTEIRLRKAACLLAGTGKGLHTKYRAALVFEDVLYAPLADVSHSERAYLALIIYRSFTHSISTPNDRAIDLLLPPEAQKCAEIYGAAIRLAVVASGRSGELLRRITLSEQYGGYTLCTSHDFVHLISERVVQRLDKLNALCTDPDGPAPLIAP